MAANVLRALRVIVLVALFAGAGAAGAAAPNGGNGPGTHSKASSFAPQGHSHRHVYGAPIQPRIVTSRKHHKQHPRDPKPK